MSAWTYINAMLDVDFGKQTDFFIEDFFARMKDENYTLFYDMKKKGEGYEITGSEMNAVVVYAPKRNFTTQFRNRHYFGQEWMISICGSLRDREFEETKKEWDRFLWKLAWFLKHDCSRISREYDYDNGVSFPGISYYMVDIRGSSGERYLHTSVDREYNKDQAGAKQ